MPDPATQTVLLLSLLFCVIAFLYSSVGHGGASGYLAVMSFFAFTPDEMASTALILNILVAGIAFGMYWRAGYFSWRLTAPFLLASAPLSYLGGLLKIPAVAYALLLAFILVYAAIRLVLTADSPKVDEKPAAEKPLPGLGVTLPIGGGIGLLSGVIGIGGGIFLSPILMLKHWAEARPTAATSALFIIVNAMFGLLGRLSRGGLELMEMVPYLAGAGLGSLLGAYLGANHFSGPTLRRLLGGVLFIAAVKLILKVL